MSEKLVASSVTRKAEAKTEPISALCQAIDESLNGGKRIRRTVLADGRINLDRLLPFLVLYRRPATRDDPGTIDLATTGGAYFIAPGDKRSERDIIKVIDTVLRLSMVRFGAFMLIELWSRPSEHSPITPASEGQHHPGFRLFGSPEGAACDAVTEVLGKNLRQTKSTGRMAKVEVVVNPRDFRHRPKLLYPKATAGLLQIGVEIEPSYVNPNTSAIYPGVLRTLRAGVDKAVRHTAFQFSRRETKFRPKTLDSFGRRGMVKAVWEVDQKLDRISSSFDFLLAVTPVNFGRLWMDFRRANYEHLSPMRYRPLPLDVSQTKRELFSIPLERIEDPTMVELFSEKQEELDRQLTMLNDRGTERFLLGSQLIYGRISQSLARCAEDLLERVPSTARSPAAGKALTPQEFVELAENEIAYYREKWEGVDARVIKTPNVLAGIMVSRGQLYVASDSKTRRNRADALLQHEVGTHLVTYFNGKAQRFAQLKSGLAGYEELQEGLAVLAEYLVSGMTPGRLRILAARVLGAKALIDGATFVDTFRLFCRYGFDPQAAFRITLRIYRGGGFIKDCVYLRGLTDLLEYLARGESFERLFVGKIALDHLDIIAELENRGVILPPKLLPRYLERPECRARLAGLRQGKKVHQLLDVDYRESEPSSPSSS